MHARILPAASCSITSFWSTIDSCLFWSLAMVDLLLPSSFVRSSFTTAPLASILQSIAKRPGEGVDCEELERRNEGTPEIGIEPLLANQGNH